LKVLLALTEIQVNYIGACDVLSNVMTARYVVDRHLNAFISDICASLEVNPFKSVYRLDIYPTE